MKIKYVIKWAYTSVYQSESGYCYSHNSKHWYDGEFLSDAELFETKIEAIEKLNELVKYGVYEIIKVYIP